MKQLLLNWLLKDINRFEVINHNNTKYKIGRIVIHKKNNSIMNDDTKYEVITSLQDYNKTLKIFI